MNERIKNIKPPRCALADEGLAAAKGHCVTRGRPSWDLAQPLSRSTRRLLLSIHPLTQLFCILVAV